MRSRTPGRGADAPRPGKDVVLRADAQLAKTVTGWDVAVPVRRGTFRIEKRVVAASKVIARRRVVADDFTFEAPTLHEEPFVEEGEADPDTASPTSSPTRR